MESADRCEEDRDSSINWLALVIIRQYTTTTNYFSDFPGHEFGASGIAIFDIISRSALVVFSLLLASYY